MDRRTFLAGTGAVLLAAPLAAEAQRAVKIARIGYLANTLAANPHAPETFLQGLRDLGYVEGRNVVIEYRDAKGKPERLPALAAELVALKVDVIVTAGGTPAVLAAKEATRTIPIVFNGAADPVTSGLVTNLARPGGNVTGTGDLPALQKILGHATLAMTMRYAHLAQGHLRKAMDAFRFSTSSAHGAKITAERAVSVDAPVAQVDRATVS